MRRHNEKTVIVLLSKRAKRDIVRELRRYPKTETGGILIGCRIGRLMLVVAATSSGKNSRHEQCRFEMDMESAAEEVNAILDRHRAIGCRVLGIWHKHNNEYNLFSYDDRETNAAYAKLNDFGAVSVLITKRGEKDVLNCYHISYNVAADTTGERLLYSIIMR